jgi:CP family cyanate transporter-like MFS transporter
MLCRFWHLGFFSPFVPKIAARFGMEPPLLISMLVLSVAMIIRVLGGSFLLFFGTLFVGLAITVGNVLLPGLIKASFPFKVGLMTGLYSFSMNGFAAISAGLSVPVATASVFDWRMGLAVWDCFRLSV